MRPHAISALALCALAAVLAGNTPASGYEFSIVAKIGDIIDGKQIDAFDFGDFGRRPVLNNNDVVAFRATTAGVKSLFTQHEVLVTVGDTIDGTTITNFSEPSINDAGTVVFLNLNHAFTQHHKVVGVGDTIDGKTIKNFINTAAINNNGTVAFFGRFDGGEGLFTQDQLLVEAGDVIDGKTIQSFSNKMEINDSGQVAFIARYSPSSTSTFALFTAEHIVNAPGVVAAGYTLDHPTINWNVAINNSGVVAFVSSFQDSNQDFFGGVFADDEVLVRTGDIIDGFEIDSSLFQPDINDLGQVAFVGRSHSDPFSAIFTPAEMVVKPGDVVDGKTITSFSNPAYNNRGTIAFYAGFSDGSSGIVLATVPEPSALALALTGATLVCAWCGKRRPRFTGLES